MMENNFSYFKVTHVCVSFHIIIYYHTKVPKAVGYVVHVATSFVYPWRVGIVTEVVV